MKKSRWLLTGLCGLVCSISVGCGASRMSEIHPTVPQGSQGDIALGWGTSVAFDYGVDGNGGVTQTSPIHVENARRSQVFAETTSGVYYLFAAANQGAQAYRNIDGTWSVYNKVSGAVTQNVTGGTYNEHNVYGQIDHNLEGYIYNEHGGSIDLNHRRGRPR